MSVDAVPKGEYVPTADRRVAMYQRSWSDFEAFIALRGEKGPRVTYLDGTLELTSPAGEHRKIEMRLARTIEAFLDLQDVPYDCLGSWLLMDASNAVGVEPDCCHIVCDKAQERPDLALEVEWTSGGIQKLEVYRRLGVGEVWIWKNGTISFHVLVNGAYEARSTSALVPTFDRVLAYQMLELPALSDVNRALRERLG